MVDLADDGKDFAFGGDLVAELAITPSRKAIAPLGVESETVAMGAGEGEAAAGCGGGSPRKAGNVLDLWMNYHTARPNS